jgi:hypothetical protein
MCGRRLQEFPVVDLLRYCREESAKADKKLKTLLVHYGTGAFKLPYPGEIRALAERLEVTLGSHFLKREMYATDRSKFDRAVTEAMRWHDWFMALGQLMQHASTMPDAVNPQPAPQDSQAGRNLEV